MYKDLPDELKGHLVCSLCLHPYPPGQSCPNCKGDDPYAAQELVARYLDIETLSEYMPALCNTVRDIRKRYQLLQEAISGGLDPQWYPDKSKREMIEKVLKALKVAIDADLNRLQRILDEDDRDMGKKK